MGTSLHKRLQLDEIHSTIAYEYENQSAREGASGFSAWDIGKVAKQTDDNSFWVLIATTPTWKRLDGTGEGSAAETLTYTDTSNKVIGPLSESPTSVAEANLFPFTGVLQEYSVDYTVREVIGGSAPGFYVCISPTSTAPGGGSFSGGSNPGTGIESVLVNGDKARVTYPV